MTLIVLWQVCAIQLKLSKICGPLPVDNISEVGSISHHQVLVITIVYCEKGIAEVILHCKYIWMYDKKI